MKKVQLPVLGGVRKVITVPSAIQQAGTTISEFANQVITLAQLKAALGITASKSGSGGAASTSLVAGPGLSGGGVLVGAVPLNLLPASVIWDEQLFTDDWVGSGGGGGTTGITVTDGTHTVTSATSVTFSGATISGATPNATVTVSGGGSTALPGTISDLVFWFESDNVLLSSSSTLAVMQNRTPWSPNNGETPAAIGAAGAPSSLNSLPTLAFASTNGRYVLQSGINLQTTATFFAVSKPSSLASNNTFSCGSNNSLQFRIETSGSLGLVQTATANIGASTGTFSTSAWTQGNATYNSSTGAYAFRIARAASGSGTNAKSITATNTAIGYNPTGSEDLTGNLAALIIYSRVLTPTEITNVENYLFSKWGV